MCSAIVAIAIGMIVIIAVIIRDESGFLNIEKTVSSKWNGRPIHAASFIFCMLSAEKSAKELLPPIVIMPSTSCPHVSVRIMAISEEPNTPSIIGMILIIPFPHILHTITISIAMIAISQLPEQLLIAPADSVRPIAIITGPVTIGGKNCIILSLPSHLINAATISYKIPAHAIPRHA